MITYRRTHIKWRSDDPRYWREYHEKFRRKDLIKQGKIKRGKMKTRRKRV